MSDEIEDENKNTIKDQFGTGTAEDLKDRDAPSQNVGGSADLSKDEKPYKAKDGLPVLFQKDEYDIYVNKVTLESYIFHGKVIDYSIDHIEYDPKDYGVIIVMKDGRKMDLGRRIQWMIRPYWERLAEIGIVRTREGESVDGVIVPIVHIKSE